MSAEPNPASDSHVGRDASREEVDQARYWDEVYAESEDNSPNWNLGEPNPEFAWRLGHDRPAIAPGRIIILGCGYGHDARLFAQRGFQVTAVDFSEWAIRGARETLSDLGEAVELLQDDVFALPERLHGQFDYVAEHTCFCAIHPSRRAEFAEVAARLLKPGGQLIGLFYHHGKHGGPPWNSTPEQIRAAFEPLFHIGTLVESEHGLERRKGKELWGRFTKRD